MIKFEALNEAVIENFRGGDGETITRMFATDSIKIMKAVLKKGCSIGRHTHETSSEIIYIISGGAKCVIDGKEEFIGAGECHYCPKGGTHSTANNGEEDLVMFCVVPEQ